MRRAPLCISHRPAMHSAIPQEFAEQLSEYLRSSRRWHGECSLLLHVRPAIRPWNRRILHGLRCICRGMPKAMSTLDLVMGATIAIVLCVYLIYALINPENF